MMLPPRDAGDPRNTPVRLRRHLLADGYDDNAIAALVKSGELLRFRRGAYVDPTSWSALDEVGRHGLAVRAAVAGARTPVVVSHTSGLPEFDVPMWGLDLSEVHLTREDGRAGRREAGVRQHCGVVDPADDVVDLNGLRVMKPARLALETCMIASVEAALCVVSHMLHAGLVSKDELFRQQEAMWNWPGTLSAEIILRLANGKVESVGEGRTLYMLWKQNLPTPEAQHVIHDLSGREIHRVDFAWPELGVFLEFDGKVKYEKYLREGERPSDVVVREKRREELICRLTGWRCIRITWADLEHPQRTAAQIRSVLFPAQAA